MTQCTTQMTLLQCGTCGVWHGLPTLMYETCRSEGGFWHCPNGHSRGFREGSDKKRITALEAEAIELRRQLRAAAHDRNTCKRKLNNMLARERANSPKGKQECPHCKKHFKRVNQHIRMKHRDIT